jgi:chaperonin GroES
MNLPTPTNDRIIVKPEKGPEISKGGIHIPDTAQKKTLKGTVLAVGPGERANVPCSPVNKSPHLTVDEFEHLQKITMDVRIPMFLKVGDIVYYAEYTGNEIEVDGQKLLVFPECDILAFDRP